MIKLLNYAFGINMIAGGRLTIIREMYIMADIEAK